MTGQITEENRKILLGDLPWSRVPASLAEAQRLMQTQPRHQFQPFSTNRLKDCR